MTTKEVAERLVELCRKGDFESAQSELFADDAISIEPYSTPDFEKETKGNGPAKPDDTVTLSMVLGESLPSSGSLLGDARSKRLSFACLRPTSCQSSEQSDSAI